MTLFYWLYCEWFLIVIPMDFIHISMGNVIMFTCNDYIYNSELEPSVFELKIMYTTAVLDFSFCSSDAMNCIVKVTGFHHGWLFII